MAISSWLRAFGCACVLVCGPLVVACTPTQAAPVVAGNAQVVTGNADYDRFFAQVNAMWHRVESAEHELPEAQLALARRLGLPETAPVDVLGARLRERTEHLALGGLTLELEFAGIEAADGADDASFADNSAGAESIPSQPPPTPTATLRTPGREPERRELRLLEVVAQAALSGAIIYADMGTLPHRARALEEKASSLRGQLTTAFSDAAQRARVQRDLDQAVASLRALHERARALANSADTLISLLDEAANTAPEGAAARRRPLREPARSPAAPAPAAGSRPPAAKAAAQPARDFEP